MAVLAAVGVALAVSVFRGPTLLTLPTTGEYAPMTKEKPLLTSNFIPNPAGPPILDPDRAIGSDLDVQTVLTLMRSNQYRLEVINISAIGFINGFRWLPLGGMTIAKLTGSSAGHCQLSGQEIACDANLKPPTCTCHGDGGHIYISFTVRQGSAAGGVSGGSGGTVHIDSMTPVFKTIPSSVQRADVPICATHQSTTAAKPCVQVP
jgi:hypothetical protein